MAKKKKFYVIWKGRKTCIFTTWEECKVQVEGYPDAKYKSFESREQAEKAFKNEYSQYVPINPKPDKAKELSEDELRRLSRSITESYSVDAACSGNPGILEYRCVHNTTKEIIFKQGPYEDGTNNIGEFLAIVDALALFKSKKITSPIYSDSQVGIGWVEKKKCRTKLEQTKSNSTLFELIERAEKWLLDNDYDNRVLKWETDIWGEIPADYERKCRF
jgi:ribonuclease HI